MSDASREAMLQHAISVLGTDLPESYRGFLLARARSPLRRAASGRIWSFVLLCPHAGENGRSLVPWIGSPFRVSLA